MLLNSLNAKGGPAPPTTKNWSAPKVTTAEVGKTLNWSESFHKATSLSEFCTIVLSASNVVPDMCQSSGKPHPPPRWSPASALVNACA